MSFLKKILSRKQETAPPKQVDRSPRVSLLPLSQELGQLVALIQDGSKES